MLSRLITTICLMRAPSPHDFGHFPIPKNWGHSDESLTGYQSSTIPPAVRNIRRAFGLGWPWTVQDLGPHSQRWGHVPLLNIQGAPIKNNPFGKINYLSYFNRFLHQIYDFHRGGFIPRTQQISLQYLIWCKNYNYLNLKLHFSKWTSN